MSLATYSSATAGTLGKLEQVLSGILSLEPARQSLSFMFLPLSRSTPGAETRAVLAVLAVAYALGSIATFAALGVDKRRAAKGERRIRESTLHALEVAFGWPGAFLGMLVFRHKVKKVRYLVVSAVATLMNLSFVGMGLFLLFR